MTTMNEPIAKPDIQYDQISGRAIRSLPLYALVPVAFALVFSAAGYPIDWKAFGLGALGWLVALFLRGPVSAIAMKLPQDRARNVVVGSSGVLEEGVRLGLIALASTGASWAVSAGQGWAAVEVLYVMINVVLIASLVKRTDEKAMQAKQFLEAQGTVQAHPLWGVLERIWASAFHVGCTLIVWRYGWSVVLLMPLHSALNLIAVRLAAKRSVPAASAFVAVAGVGTLAVGLLTI
ncbi:hypothetical protein J19TS2_31450 [Cohnella xylanilytica]|uniref:YhfC family intramembrane metalloprotease n=1 Tax=Cohnella xylanilytica TaxID=557555 RepID=A0A841U8D4_9BACL|nr:YhfC family glutamic-type intramembrane protease [Cohnella xylanilytica]MBB6694281.1 YhfC family intramembrane metalloprotease [Cohnella xylanilytica]GIO13590.1 hypothetical protein J19TS2_31450 [Cohnella xylanilytica]